MINYISIHCKQLRKTNTFDINHVAIYCARKRILDENVIDSSIFTIPVNAQNLHANETFCSEENKKIDVDIRRMLTDAITELAEFKFSKRETHCMFDKDKEGRYIDR